MQTVLKIGGLVFSAGLTLSLFARLFGLTPFGLLMALAALALFEGGAAGWAHLLKKGREAQRAVAGTCLVISVALSLFSSGAEIVMATRFGADALKQLDFQFLTLCSIVTALAANVIGALAFEAMHPETRRAAETLSFEGRMADMQHKAKEKIMDKAEVVADARIDNDGSQMALMIAGRAYEETMASIRELSAPRGRQEVTVTHDSSPYQLPSRNVRPTISVPLTSSARWELADVANMAVGGGSDSSQRPGRAPFSPLHANGPTVSTGMNHRRPSTPAEDEPMVNYQQDEEAPKAHPREGSKNHHAPTASATSHSQTPPEWLNRTV